MESTNSLYSKSKMELSSMSFVGSVMVFSEESHGVPISLSVGSSWECLSDLSELMKGQILEWPSGML
jgi:hypothetical protein